MERVGVGASVFLPRAGRRSLLIDTVLFARLLLDGENARRLLTPHQCSFHGCRLGFRRSEGRFEQRRNFKELAPLENRLQKSQIELRDAHREADHSGNDVVIYNVHGCGSADFNCDGDVGTDLDIETFFACLAGACPAAPCLNSADFNGDGDIGTDADIEAFFRVLAGGTC